MGLDVGMELGERRELLSLRPSGKNTVSSAAFCAAQRLFTSSCWREWPKHFLCQLLPEKRHCRQSAGWDLNFTASFHFHLVSSAHTLDANVAKL